MKTILLLLIFNFCNAISYEDYEKCQSLNNDGYKYAVDHNFNESIICFQSSIKIDNDYERNRYAISMLGQCYYDIGNFSDSIKCYISTINSYKDDHDPRLLDVYLKLGMSQTRNCEYDSAIISYNTGYEINNKNINLKNNYAWLIATAPTLKIRDSKFSLSLAEDVVKETHHGKPYYLDTYAAALAENGEFDKAIIWQKKAIKLVGQDKAFDFNLKVKLYEKKIKYRLDITIDKAMKLLNDENNKL